MKKTTDYSKHAFNYHGLRLAYYKIGSGKPLLLLHGWGVNSEVMLPLAKQLSSLHTCYLIDLPGFGQSPPPRAAWNISDYADMLEEFINMHTDHPTDLLVHSFGGRIVLKLCARPSARNRVHKVLITGGAGMKPRRNFVFYFKKCLAKTLKAPFQILSSNQKEKALKRLRKTKLWNWLGSDDYKKLSGAMRETFVKSVTEYLEPCLPKIPHETLLLWGRNDKATPLYQAERMEKGIKNAALVVIENAGHYAFLDRPARFTAIAKAFLDKN